MNILKIRNGLACAAALSLLFFANSSEAQFLSGYCTRTSLVTSESEYLVAKTFRFWPAIFSFDFGDQHVSLYSNPISSLRKQGSELVREIRIFDASSGSAIAVIQGGSGTVGEYHYSCQVSHPGQIDLKALSRSAAVQRLFELAKSYSPIVRQTIEKITDQGFKPGYGTKFGEQPARISTLRKFKNYTLYRLRWSFYRVHERTYDRATISMDALVFRDPNTAMVTRVAVRSVRDETELNLPWRGGANTSGGR